MIRKMAAFLLSLAVFIGLTTFQSAKAQSSLDYYKGLFQSWGIYADTLPQEKRAALNSPATKKDVRILLNQLEGKDINEYKAQDEMIRDEIIKVAPKNPTLLAFSSQLSAKIPPYKNIIIICDSNETAFVLKDVACKPSSLGSLNFADLNPYDPFIPDKILKTTGPFMIDGARYYTLPQVLLITPQYQKYVGDYFKALSRAQASDWVGDVKEGLLSIPLDLITRLRGSSVSESVGYILAVLLFVSAFKPILAIIVHNPKQLIEKRLYVNAVNKWLSFLAKISGRTLLIFIILALFYMPILYVLDSKGRQLGDSTYQLRYLTTTLNPLNIPKYLTAQSFFGLGFFFYNSALALFGLLALLPNLVAILTLSRRKVAKTKLKTDLVKWGLPALVAASAVLLAFFDLEALASFLVLSPVLLAATLLYIRGQHFDYANLFTKKERRLVFGAMLVMLALNIFYPLYINSRPIKYAYEPLIGIKENIVALPYSKSWGKHVLFEPRYYSGNSKIFAGAYLIYVPNATKIVNKPLKNFAPNNNGLTIISRKSSAVVETLLKNPQLLPYLSTTQLSPLFALDRESIDLIKTDTLKVQLSFNCNLTPASASVKLEVLNLNKYVPEQGPYSDKKIEPVSTELATLMNFPGCKTEIGLESFELPIDIYFSPREFALLRIRGIDAKYLADFKILAEGQPLPIKFISKEVLDDARYNVLYTSTSFSNEVVAYSTDIKKEFIVDLKNTEEGFDLSGPINELMKKSLLKNPFIIWTNEPNEIIQKI